MSGEVLIVISWQGLLSLEITLNTRINGNSAFNISSASSSLIAGNVAGYCFVVGDFSAEYFPCSSAPSLNISDCDFNVAFQAEALEVDIDYSFSLLMLLKMGLIYLREFFFCRGYQLDWWCWFWAWPHRLSIKQCVVMVTHVKNTPRPFESCPFPIGRLVLQFNTIKDVAFYSTAISKWKF